MSKQFSWAKAPKKIDESLIQTEYEADLVIIGAGHAGTCAARAATEEGASVIVLEQQEEKTQRILGIGEIGHINSKWQASHNIPKVDIDTFVNDWQLRTNNRSNVKLIKKYAEECGACFDWFIEPLTKEEVAQIRPGLTPPSPHMPKSLNGIHAWSGTPYMGMLLMIKTVKENQRIAKEKGAKFYYGVKAAQIDTDEEGNVIGVVGQTKEGTYYRYKANKGVLIAAGDYSKNQEMCEDLLVEASDLISEGDWSGHGWDGSGIRLGMHAGGRLEPRSHAAAGGNYSFPGFDLIGSTATLRVNKHGKRYSNEGFGNHILAALAGAKQPNGMLYGIFDSRIYEQLEYQVNNNGVFDYTDPERMKDLKDTLEAVSNQKGQPYMHKYIDGGIRPVWCADTLEDLAKQLFETIEDRQTFLQEVTRYNELCYQGKDEDFGKEKVLMFPIDNPPFYASGVVKDSHIPGGQSLKILVTVSGLLIDENQQVLGSDFEPIQGLYATGNSSGCRFGLEYSTSVAGQSISMAQTLGREVGKYISKLK